MAIKFTELPPATRAGIITLVAVDAGLRFWAVRDLRSRKKSEVNGPRIAWSLALGLVNSAGLLPAAYLLRGRRTTPSAAEAE